MAVCATLVVLYTLKPIFTGKLVLSTTNKFNYLMVEMCSKLIFGSVSVYLAEQSANIPTEVVFGLALACIAHIVFFFGQDPDRTQHEKKSATEATRI